MLKLMCVPETLLILTSSLISVPLFTNCFPELSDNLTWTAVSFLVVFPLQSTLTNAYARRERAIDHVSRFRALMINVFNANATWDWPGAETYNGRREDNKPLDRGGRGVKKKPCNVPLSSQHRARVKYVCFRITEALQDLLLVPRSGNPRETMSWGVEEKRQIDSAERTGRKCAVKLLSRLHGATEELKAAGMPAN